MDSRRILDPLGHHLFVWGWTRTQVRAAPAPWQSANLLRLKSDSNKIEKPKPYLFNDQK
jgi:hypothetical protein